MSISLDKAHGGHETCLLGSGIAGWGRSGAARCAGAAKAVLLGKMELEDRTRSTPPSRTAGGSRSTSPSEQQEEAPPPPTRSRKMAPPYHVLSLRQRGEAGGGPGWRKVRPYHRLTGIVGGDGGWPPAMARGFHCQPNRGASCAGPDEEAAAFRAHHRLADSDPGRCW